VSWGRHARRPPGGSHRPAAARPLRDDNERSSRDGEGERERPGFIAEAGGEQDIRGHIECGHFEAAVRVF
jgi:hypothetical protein